MSDDERALPEFTDRYKALGIPYPDPATMCDGDCEGVGMVPIKADDLDRPEYRALWEAAHAKPHTEPCDGWHFVRCPKCNGTGKKP